MLEYYNLKPERNKKNKKKWKLNENIVFDGG